MFTNLVLTLFIVMFSTTSSTAEIELPVVQNVKTTDTIRDIISKNDPYPTMITVDGSDTIDVFSYDFSTDRNGHNIRYFKSKLSHKIRIWEWKGSAPIQEERLKETISAVLNRLPMVQDDPNLVQLLLETAAVESDMGSLTRQKGGGPALGTYQILPSTAKYLRTWLKNNHKDVYAAVEGFYDKKKNLNQNLIDNIPYQIAMSTAYYWCRTGIKLHKKVSTIKSRARLYKAEYNTARGKGSVKKYVEKAALHLVTQL